MCKDTTIKELLPAYREQALDRTEMLMIENHLASCEDCRNELSLLRMMAEEAVPDPGEAFWAAMPGRVYQCCSDAAIGTENLRPRLASGPDSPSPLGMGSSISSDRSVISWLIIRPGQKRTGDASSAGI